MNSHMDIMYRETWHDTDPEYNFVKVALRRYQRELYGRCDYILDYLVIVEGETVLHRLEAREDLLTAPGLIREAITKFDDLKQNHPAYMAKSEDNNSLGSGQC